MPLKINLDSLKEGVSDSIAEGLQGLVEGAKEDLKEFAKAISEDLLEAHLEGDVDLQGQLADQVKILAEINRVRVEAHVWVVVQKIAKVAIQAAAKGAAAAFHVPL